MKKLPLIAALLVSAFVADAAECLRVTPKDGSPVTFMFGDSPEVSFTGSRLKVKSSSQPSGIYFEIDEIDAIDFADESALSVVRSEGVEVRADASGIHFTGIPMDATVGVFSVSGTVIFTGTCTGGEYHLLRADVPSGIYIVKINEFTLKTAL